MAYIRYCTIGCILPSLQSGYINININLISPVIITLPSKLHLLPTSYSSTADEMTKQIAEPVKHVKHEHNASTLPRKSNPNPSHTHQQHCERLCGHDEESLHHRRTLVRVRILHSLRTDIERQLAVCRLTEVLG